MEDLVCDYCGEDIKAGYMYIETQNGDIYHDEEELIEDLEQQDYFTWKQAPEDE